MPGMKASMNWTNAVALPILLLWQTGLCQVEPIGVECLGDVGFFLFNETVDFETASDLCVANNSTLARISNENEFQSVLTLRAAANVEVDMWIGSLAFIRLVCQGSNHACLTQELCKLGI